MRGRDSCWTQQLRSVLSVPFTASSGVIRERAIIYFVAFHWPVFPIRICDVLTEFPGTCRRGTICPGQHFQPFEEREAAQAKLLHPCFSSTFPPIASQIAFHRGRSSHHKQAVTSVTDI